MVRKVGVRAYLVHRLIMHRSVWCDWTVPMPFERRPGAKGAPRPVMARTGAPRGSAPCEVVIAEGPSTDPRKSRGDTAMRRETRLGPPETPGLLGSQPSW